MNRIDCPIVNSRPAGRACARLRPGGDCAVTALLVAADRRSPVHSKIRQLDWRARRREILFPTTFLMVFLIQSTQNRDAKAVQLKLDELIRAQKRARNVLADLEDASGKSCASSRRSSRRCAEKGLTGEKAAREAAARTGD